MEKFKKYLWMLPALFVSYEFAEKHTEVLNDPTEFANIISVIQPLKTITIPLAYFVGFWDLIIAILLLVIPNISKKYSKYIFIWVILWPLIPASIRYFGGVAEFEIIEIIAIISCGVLSFLLYEKFNE